MADTTWSAFQASITSLTARDWILIVTSSWLTFKLLQVLYNISPLHPLHKIPGPKLAAATYLPEFYYDVILVGRYTHAIRQMHDKYGPIVRINPNELHCADMSFSDEIYAVGGRKRDKPFHQVNGSAAGTGNAFGTVDHDLHRARRAPVAKFFSRAMIARLEQEVHELVQTLCNKLLAQNNGKKERKAFDIAHAYSCFTSDAISSYCFGEPFGLLSQNDWQPNYREATLAVLKPVFLFRFFPFLVGGVKLGEYLVDYLPTDVALLIRTLQIDIPSRVQKTKTELDSGIVYERPTIFADLLQSELDESEKNQDRLVSEAVTIVNAGTETTSWALAVITYFLLSRPEILAKLQGELKQVVDDPRHLPSWTTLEQLPYLGAVINEGLRLSYGVSSRSARVPTTEDLEYRGEFNKKPTSLVLPRGYAIGMSAAISHHDESVFPDSYSFIPERWIDEDNKIRKDLERSMLTFSKGSRGCLGKNLALCELYLSLTALVLRVMPHMRLFETTERDIRYDHDMFIPMTENGSTGVRVIIEN
ncbi:cytochrome P450 monooxygenase oxidoreductase [Fusarium beomiforme]|uniref:Cytochrome P450 monooxygenase oxidoreductase n=1 Tax=Fusarium beomiforme TaxID=44412 RepID=A0A9P5DQR4_9HYPO|nr:cytochrome P450 monooxygenase oxidoreductase [Fusarium beomiforme]